MITVIRTEAPIDHIRIKCDSTPNLTQDIVEVSLTPQDSIRINETMSDRISRYSRENAKELADSIYQLLEEN